MSSTKSNNKVIPANIYFLQQVISHPFVLQRSPVTNEYQTAALGDTVHHPVHMGFVVSWTQLCTYPAVVKFSLEQPFTAGTSAKSCSVQQLQENTITANPKIFKSCHEKFTPSVQTV